MSRIIYDERKVETWKEEFCNLFCPCFGRDNHEVLKGSKCASSADNVTLDYIVEFIEKLLIQTVKAERRKMRLNNCRKCQLNIKKTNSRHSRYCFLRKSYRT